MSRENSRKKELEFQISKHEHLLRMARNKKARKDIEKMIENFKEEFDKQP